MNVGVSINNSKGKEGYKKQRRGMYKAERGMGMRLGERERGRHQPDTHTPKLAQVEERKNLRRRMALFRFVPGDGCREASGCRLGQRPCMTRTPQRTGGRHTELL